MWSIDFVCNTKHVRNNTKYGVNNIWGLPNRSDEKCSSSVLLWNCVQFVAQFSTFGTVQFSFPRTPVNLTVNRVTRLLSICSRMIIQIQARSRRITGIAALTKTDSPVSCACEFEYHTELRPQTLLSRGCDIIFEGHLRIASGVAENQRLKC